MAVNVILEINNKNYYGWKKATISRSMETFLGTFSMDLVSSSGSNPYGLVKKGDKCRLYVGNPAGRVKEIEILTGYIVDLDREKDGNSTSMHIAGVDITQDLVDCSAIIDSNSWTSATVVKMAEDLAAPYDIFVDDRTDTEKKYKNFTIENGESCFDVIERAARSEAVLPLSDRFGHLVLTYAADKNSPSIQDLVDGENILAISEKGSIRNVYSEYIFKGQNSGNGSAWDSSTTRLKATAKDTTVSRHRPLVVLSETKTDQEKLQTRANWEAQVRAGRAESYTVKLLSWFIDPPSNTSDLRPWVPNAIVNLISTDWDINKKMLVTSVTFDLDATTGATTSLVLKDPRTYAKNPDGEVTA